MPPRTSLTPSLLLAGLLALILASPAAAKGPALALTRADTPGLARNAGMAVTARTALLDPAAPALRRALTAQGVDARGYRRRRAPRVWLGSVGVAPGVTRTARAGLAAWAARARARGLKPVRAVLGDGALVTTARDGRRGSRIEVAVVQGGALGLVVLRAPDRRAGWRRTALIYARSAVARLRPAGLPVYRRLLARVPPSGVVPKSLALQMFAAAYGRVPGVRLPPGDIGPVQDGTQAFAAVSRYLPVLPAAQRAVILRRAGMSAPAAATSTARSAAIPVGDPDFVPNASLQTSVNTWAGVYASRLGHPLTITIVAGYSPGKDQKPGAFADAFPLNSSGVYGTGDEVTCRVRMLPNGAKSSLAFQVLVLAHETFHCFQFDLRKPDWTFTPAWIGEGSADWAALSVDPVSYPTGGGNITDYVQNPQRQLFARAYDAVGFFGHADEVGGDLWKRIAQVITTPGDVTDAGIAAGSLDTFDQSWGSTVWNLRELGAEWAVNRPLVAPSSVQAPPTVVGGSTAMSAPAWTTAQYFVDGTDPAFADTPLLLVQTKNVHVRLADGSIDILDPDRWFCLHGRCTCPKGTEGEPPKSTHVGPAVFIGLSGDDEQAAGTLSFRSLDDFCSKKNQPRPPRSQPPSGGGSACGGGCGGSNGDPHMTSFDGTRWDFQAVGEFTLAKSTTDDLEIQARQEPWTPTDYVTVNTAVAMRVTGHRVAVYAGDPLTVRVDGRAVRLTGGAVAVGAGRITPIGSDEIRVDWPDGTYTRVWSVGSWGVAMLVAPAPARAGTLVGLLGNFNGNPDDDATTRAGKVLPATVLTDLRGGFRLRYGDFGGSWRITQAQSLFDYAGGQSTATFTNKAFPKKPYGVTDLTPAQRTRAQARCAAFGITDPVLLEDCILDVGATGQDGFAQSALEQQAAEAGPTVAWTGMPSLAGQRGAPSLAVTPDGTVHVAALFPGTPDRVLHAAIGADGTQRGPDEVLARRGLGDPRLSVGPGGTLYLGLTAIFQSPGEVPPFPPGATPQDGAYSLTAPQAGAPWTLDAWLANGGFAYAGVAQQAVVPGGRVTVLTTNGYARLVAGVGKTAAAYVDPSTSASCITAIPPAEVAADGGQVWAVWLQDSCDARGVYAAPVSATTAALQAAPALAPLSVYPAAGGTRVEGSEPVITARPGGGVYLAYATQQAGGAWHLMLWRLGAATALDAGPIAGDPNGVFTSAAPDGSVWVAWLDGGTLRARRTGPDATAVLPGTLAAQPPTPNDSYDWAVAATARGLVVVAGSRGAGGQLSETTLAP